MHDGKLLYEVPALHDRWHVDDFATSLHGIRDVDGDGILDWIVGANGEEEDPFSGEGYVWICSGKDGKRIREVVRDDSHGYDVCVLGDVDGDGVVDLGFLVESSKGRWTEAFDPELRVVSSKDGHVIWKTTTRALRALREDLAPRLLPPAEPRLPEKPR